MDKIRAWGAAYVDRADVADTENAHWPMEGLDGDCEDGTQPDLPAVSPARGDDAGDGSGADGSR